jgi:hypothetical protein
MVQAAEIEKMSLDERLQTMELLRLFPDLRWEKEVRRERTAMMGRQRWVKLVG